MRFLRMLSKHCAPVSLSARLQASFPCDQGRCDQGRVVVFNVSNKVPHRSSAPLSDYVGTGSSVTYVSKSTS